MDVEWVTEIWEPTRDRRLGRSAPVMLTNVLPDLSKLDAKIAELQQGAAVSTMVT
jgi:hypothetical protein